MNNLSKSLPILSVLLFAFAGVSDENLSGRENSFVEFASQGNLAQLRKIDTSDFNPATFFMALLESIESKATRTTEFLLSIHKYHDFDLRVPLNKAAAGGQLPQVELLIKHGADIDAFSDGETPLMVSAAKGQDKVVEMLLALRARTDLLSLRTGQTAYDMAKQMGHRSTMKIKGLKSERRMASSSKFWTDFSVVAPYVSSAIAVVGGYLLLRAVGLVGGRNIPVAREQQRGLALRLAPDPRSIEQAAPPAHTIRLAEMEPIFALINGLPQQFRAAGLAAMMPALRAPAHMRPEMVAIGMQLIAGFMAHQASNRFNDLIEGGKNKLLAIALAALQRKLEERPEPRAAPAA